MAKMVRDTLDTEYKGSIFGRLAAYMTPYKKQMLLCLVLVLVVTACELVRPVLIGDAIDIYIEGYNEPYCIVENSDLTFQGQSLSRAENCSSYAQILMVDEQYVYFTDLNAEESASLLSLTEEGPVTSAQISALNLSGQVLSQDDLKELRHQDFMGIVKVGLLYMGILMVSLVCSYIQTMTLNQTGQNIIYTVREQLFHHVHSLPLRYFDTHPVGQIVTRITNDVESLNEMYSRILARLFKSTVKIMGLAVVMLVMNVKLALMSFVMVPVITVAIVIFKNLSRKVHRAIRTRISQLNTFLSENISGMRLIQIFANEQMKYEEFSEKTMDLYKANLKQLFVFAVFRPLIYFLSQIALSIVLIGGGLSVIESTLTVGTLYIFINYISNFFEPIQDMAEQFSTLQNAFASAEKIFVVQDEINTITEIENPVKLNEVKGKIEFKNVWFAYEDDNYVLRDVSFVIQPGEKVAFVGATGAGKSSILNLIGRYYDIQKGQILIDDVDLKELSIHEVRKAIGQVQQDVFIFTGDVASNIRLLNEEISDEQIKDASKEVNAAHFIEQMPNQYHEPVSERGSTLSQGQRQLLSFARTLAVDPKILVMDEATANIDTETEQLIQKALETLMDGRTTIMVAHRLSTIQHADNIIVMHKGKIREQGTHQELLKQDGLYKKLYELQLYSENA
ncbi:MAG: ABC transporter ATP-binding protein [Erysipelotrichaceae bacterium]|nr:ABC transporter ATP-binding protein [Erysipelotrichaceae bacterium]